MTYEDLAEHLQALGLARGESVPDGFWTDYPQAPPVLRWFFDEFAGSSFLEGAVYSLAGHDVMVGWFLESNELAETIEDTSDAVPADMVPIENDGGDNHLMVGVGEGNAGKVYRHQHDAPTDRNLELVDDSLEHFLRTLRPAK